MEKIDLETLRSEYRALEAEVERHRAAWVDEAARANKLLSDVEHLTAFCEKLFGVAITSAEDIRSYLAVCYHKAQAAAEQPFEDGKRLGFWEGRSSAYKKVQDRIQELHAAGRLESGAWAVMNEAIQNLEEDSWYAQD